MADISNLKINERANVEQPKIGRIGNRAEYRMDEQFQNLLIFGILIIFQIKNKIWIPKVSNLENFQNF